jgi:very-short-patch-repair endonuclease
MDKSAAELLIARKWPRTDVASTAALRHAGLDDRLLTQAVRAGALVRLRRGAYILARRWAALPPWEKDAARIDAHIEGTGGTSVYCLSSAAVIHGLSVWNTGPLVHVATEYAGSTTSRGADSRSHRLDLGAKDVVVTIRRGRRLSVTSKARTAADCARLLPFEEAVVIGDSALFSGVPREAILEAVVSGSARGRRRALTVLESLEPTTESVGESRTRVLIERLGFARPVAQLRLMTAEGPHRVDFAWVELRIIIEFDGEGKYMDYAPTPQVLLAERRRENLLMEQGWIFVRLRWSDLEKREEVRRRLEAAIARARRRIA